jgi:hypothetical protein
MVRGGVMPNINLAVDVRLSTSDGLYLRRVKHTCDNRLCMLYGQNLLNISYQRHGLTIYLIRNAYI